MYYATSSIWLIPSLVASFIALTLIVTLSLAELIHFSEWGDQETTPAITWSVESIVYSAIAALGSGSVLGLAYSQDDSVCQIDVRDKAAVLFFVANLVPLAIIFAKLAGYVYRKNRAYFSLTKTVTVRGGLSG
jgi:hypothetical protein